MKTSLALIPPTSIAEDYINERSCFLLLPHLFNCETYQDYARKVQETDALTILDNGAFEGIDVPNHHLVKLANLYEVDEVVVPDVMKNAAETLARLQTFYDTVMLMRDQHTRTPKQYMAVVQGTTLGECADFISALSTSSSVQYVTTLGLPRHLLETTQDTRVRLKLAKHIRHWYGRRYAIHFLGASPLWPAEVGYLHEFEVRSIDTSMPFVYAYHKSKIGPTAPRHERPEGYFELQEHELDEEKLTYNVFRMSRWVEDGI